MGSMKGFNHALMSVAVLYVHTMINSNCVHTCMKTHTKMKMGKLTSQPTGIDIPQSLHCDSGLLEKKMEVYVNTQE